MSAAAVAFTTHTYDPDVQLMLRVREGDMPAFEALVRKHRGGVIQFLYGMVHDRAIAEELAQEAFLRLYLTRERYEPTAKFTSWLYLIARHLGLNWVRDHTRERGIEYIAAHRPGSRAFQLRDRSPDLTERLQHKARNESIQRAVRNLPERQRTVIVMSKFRGHDCLEIARELDCSHQAVRSLLFRAYATLRQTLDPEVL